MANVTFHYPLLLLSVVNLQWKMLEGIQRTLLTILGMKYISQIILGVSFSRKKIKLDDVYLVFRM